MSDTLNGFILAATGEKHIILAQKSARSLRQVMPDANIDLFTDEPIEDDVFDQIHLLQDDWFRPRIDALMQSRFERTICIDSDIVITAPVDFVFDILDKYEFAACRAIYYNTPKYTSQNKRIPEAFSPVNSGFIALRKTDQVMKLLKNWKRILKRQETKFDQGVLRRLLFNSDVSLYILPNTLNFMLSGSTELPNMDLGRPPPLVLHFGGIGSSNRRGYEISDPHLPYNLDELLNKRKARRLKFHQKITKMSRPRKRGAIRQFLRKSKT